MLAAVTFLGRGQGKDRPESAPYARPLIISTTSVSLPFTGT